MWLTQNQIALLFETSKNNISIHLRNIFIENEADYKRTVKESLTVQQEGDRKIKRIIRMYNLDVILSVGFRIKSTRGNMFRRWANGVLKNHLLNDIE